MAVWSEIYKESAAGRRIHCQRVVYFDSAHKTWNSASHTERLARQLGLLLQAAGRTGVHHRTPVRLGRRVRNRQNGLRVLLHDDGRQALATFERGASEAVRLSFTVNDLKILSSCGTLDKRLAAAAADKGVAQARVALPAWPSRCRAVEPHAPIAAGDEVRSVLKRERAALDRVNARVVGCATFYDALRRRLK